MSITPITRAEVLHEFGQILAQMRETREAKRERKESIVAIELIIDRLQTGYDFILHHMPLDQFPPRPQ